MWEEDLEGAARRRSAVVIAVIVAAALAGGLWYWYSVHHRPVPPPPAVQAPPPPPPASTEPQIANPVPAENAPGAAALPALNDSDELVRDSIAGVLGRAPVERFLAPQNIVRHIVVTVDNLPRKKVAVDLRPVRATPGQTAVSSQGEITALSEANFERYAPLVKVVQGVDVKSLSLVYQRLYPLFQQAYEDLGYPGKYFNDRLVEVIDQLLQAPEVQPPIPLKQPRVMYEYADADLEGRSSGQKLLIRMGPANARAVKAKLRAFRAEIANKNKK